MPRVSISVGTEPWWQENSVMMATMLMEMAATQTVRLAITTDAARLYHTRIQSIIPVRQIVQADIIRTQQLIYAQAVIIRV